MRQSDVWLFRIGGGVVTFAALYVGCIKAGRYLHEDDATTRWTRTRAESEARDDALYLAHGFNDTKGYREMVSYLSQEEAAASYAKKHVLEENKEKIAGVGAVVVALLLGESARVWARKQDAKRRLSGR
jgi:hypothetical protein